MRAEQSARGREEVISREASRSAGKGCGEEGRRGFGGSWEKLKRGFTETVVYRFQPNSGERVPLRRSQPEKEGTMVLNF